MMKHLRLDMVGQVARGTAKVGSRLYEMPPLTFRVGPSLRPVPPRRVGGGISSLSTMSDSSSEEVWKPVPGYERRYEVSNHGHVRSLKRSANVLGGGTRSVNGRILSQADHSNGYKQVNLCKEGNCQNAFVHRLVLKAFGPPPPSENANQVNHLDGDKTNNHIENLEWCTHHENTEHAVESDLYPTGAARHNTRLTAKDVRKLRRRRRENGTTYEKLAEPFDVGWETIYQAVTGRSWSHIDSPPPVESKGLHDTQLSDDQVRLARKLRRQDGMTFQAIAGRLGVSYTCARQAIIGRTSKHITNPPPTQ